MLKIENVKIEHFTSVYEYFKQSPKTSTIPIFPN